MSSPNQRKRVQREATNYIQDQNLISGKEIMFLISLNYVFLGDNYDNLMKDFHMSDRAEECFMCCHNLPL